MMKKNTTNAKNPSARKGMDGQHAAISEYVADVERMWKTGTAREHTYRFALVNLLETLIPGSTVVNDGAQIECGAPDCTIIRNGMAVGYVEAKNIGVGDLEGKKTTGNKEQFDRYKASLDNIAFTDYLEFLFYSKGFLVDSVRIAEIAWKDIRPLPDNFGKFLSLVEKLGNAAPQNIASPARLAQLMAAKARLLQTVTCNFLSGDGAHGSMLWNLMEDFKRVLLPDTKPEEFADIYAQTLTYGMFAARLHDDTPENFSRFEAAALIPKSNPFLKKLFFHLASDIEKPILWVVDDIVNLFAAADVANIMKDYGKSTKQSDPMIHFYEDFLAAYDAGLRKDRGVWYTPLPVVRFIVRAVDDLLSSRFGIEDGLASRDKVEISVTEDCATGKKLTRTVKKVVPKVQILDPATGTGTFLAECVNRIYGRFRKNAGKWPGYVMEDLIPRLNGFEILMASYTMAHIKLDLVLAATGYRHLDDKRFNVFLTNSLEEYKDSFGPIFSYELGEEANAANVVKRDCPVMVVMGNPPYSGESQNKGDKLKWFKEFLDDYKKEPGGTDPLKERNPKWLNDDYVKFLRLAQHYIEKDGKRGRDGKEGRTGTGIVGYINPHGFLDNPTFRGMRWNLLKTFDEIYVLNLHGNAKKHEVCPDGGKDENVFSIMQGVSINLFVKTGKKPANALGKVFYSDLWGKRKDKYAFLESTDFADVAYEEVKPVAPMYFFVPKNIKGASTYTKGFMLTEIMPINGVGITTKRDGIAIQRTDNDIRSVIHDFATLTESEIKEKYSIVSESTETLVSRAIQNVKECGDMAKNYQKITYRPFDVRHTYFTDFVRGFLSRPVYKLMHHFADGDNLGLIVGRQGQAVGSGMWNVVFVTDSIVDLNMFYRGGGCTFPLYLYHDTMGKVEKVPNFNKEVFERIADGLNRKPSPEELFDYIYAVLHTPEYRERYKEFLKVDFPRIPYPTDAAVFKKLAKIGGELRETHLLKIKPTTSERNRTANFPKSGNNTVEDVRFVNGKVHISDEQYFDHVPEEAWSMFIGGYQPAQKWLKDRKGRVLTNEDIDHYQEIIFALSRTHALMQKLSVLSKDWLK